MKQPMKYSSGNIGFWIFNFPIISSKLSMYADRLADCSMCLKESINSKEVSAANLLLISAANSGHVRVFVFIPVLLNQ
jgi:hypothetical protein